MFKKLLMSGLVLGALAATVGAGSLSAFSSEATTSGSLALGTVHLQTHDGVGWNDGSTVVFTPQNLTPGHFSDATTYLRNTGTAEIGGIVSSSAVTQTSNGGHLDCANYVVISDFSVPTTLAAGAQAGPITVRATLGDAPNYCQGTTFQIATTFAGVAS